MKKNLTVKKKNSESKLKAIALTSKTKPTCSKSKKTNCSKNSVLARKLSRKLSLSNRKCSKNSRKWRRKLPLDSKLLKLQKLRKKN